MAEPGQEARGTVRSSRALAAPVPLKVRTMSEGTQQVGMGGTEDDVILSSSPAAALTVNRDMPLMARGLSTGSRQKDPFSVAPKAAPRVLRRGDEDGSARVQFRSGASFGSVVTFSGVDVTPSMVKRKSQMSTTTSATNSTAVSAKERLGEEGYDFGTPLHFQAVLSEKTMLMLKRLTLMETPKTLAVDNDSMGASYTVVTQMDAPHPQTDILGVLIIADSPVFLIRLLEKRDRGKEFCKYYLRKLNDFAQLDTGLYEDKQDNAQGWGYTPLPMIPDLPELARPSWAKQASEDELSEQRAELQEYLQMLVSQVKTVKENRVLKAFFGQYPLDEESVLNELVKGLRSDTSLKTMAGFWKLQGSIRVWKIQESGKVEIDGKYRGPDYDLKETGEGRKHEIRRGDDWQVDLDKSSQDKLVWRKHGQARKTWFREANHLAYAMLAKVDAVRKKRAEAEAAAAGGSFTQGAVGGIV